MSARHHIMSAAEMGKGAVRVELPTLPKGWRYASVAKMGASDEQAVLTGPFGTNLGRADFIDKGVPLLTISCLTHQGIRLDKALFVSEEKAKGLQRYRLKVGDVLFSRMASVGRAGIVGPDLEGTLFNYHIMRLRLNHSKLLPKFFTNYVQGAKQVRDYLLAVNHGATRDGINTEQLLALPVIVAPISEQQRVVAEIERQFTRLDAGVAALRRVQANLKRYRAAVLKAACEGRLVPTEAELAKAEGRTYETGEQLLARILADRRKNRRGRGKYKEPATPDATSHPPLPEGWIWATVDQLAAETMIGLDRGRAQQHGDPSSGVPYIKMNNVTMDGHVRYDGMVYVIVDDAELERYGIRDGDILFNTRNSKELVGKVGIVRNPPERAIYNNNLMRIRPTPDVVSPFLCLQMCSPGFRRRLELVKKATTNVAAVYAKDLLPLGIALPSFAEQARIVSEVERRLSVIEELEAAVAANLRRAERLRQAILTKVFSETHVAS